MSAPAAIGDMITLDSGLLGALDIRADTVIEFASGLPGFPDLRRFALVETQREELVWLQSVDDPKTTFLTADPFDVVAGFEIDVPEADLAALGSPADADALLVLVVVHLSGGVPRTANLQSPIVIDRQSRVGRQVVVPDSRDGMQYPIDVRD